MQPRLDCWLQTQALPSSEMEQDWSHSREMPSGDKSQHSEHFFFHLDLLWITGLSSRHQDVHCKKWGCLTPSRGFYRVSLSPEKKSGDLNPNTESRLPLLHSVCCNDTDTYLCPGSRLECLPDPEGWLSGSKVRKACSLYTCLAADTHRLQIWK